MSIEAAILERLQGDIITGDGGGVADITSGRVYATSLPQGVDLPAVSFFRTGTDPIVYVDGSTDPTQNTKFEVVAWAATYAAAKELAEAIRIVMEGRESFRAVWLNQADQYNAVPEVFFVVQEFSIWSST